MAITSTSQARVGGVTTVTVVSDLVGSVFYHWYVDGAFVASTSSPSWSFFVGVGEQCRVDTIDTLDPDFDPIANAPEGYPARRSLWWVASPGMGVGRYRVDQKLGAGAWSSVGAVVHDQGLWSYALLSPRLVDLASYTWRVVPVDAAGNDGTALEVGPETVVRAPDAPGFTVSFNESTTRVTFNAA